jgi:hypothetical protein
MRTHAVQQTVRRSCRRSKAIQIEEPWRSACACDRCIAAAARKLGATKEEIAVGISVNAGPGLVYSPERLTHSISMRQLDIIFRRKIVRHRSNLSGEARPSVTQTEL